MGRTPFVLSAQDARTLRRVAGAARTPPEVARRARVVLAAAGRAAPGTAAGPGAGPDAEPDGGPRIAAATTRRWVRRYREEGLAGLADRPRAGRPPTPVAAADPLLVAPLLMPTAGWSSHTLAELTGRSQGAVARAWRRAHPDDGSVAGQRLPAAGLRLEAAAAGATNSLLVLSGGTPPHLPYTGRVMRSPRRPALQTLLAADLLAAARPAGADEATGDPEGDAALVARVRRRLAAAVPVHVLTRRPVDGLPPDVAEVVVGGPAAWQALLADLVRRCTRSTPAELLAVQTLAMEWARSDRPRFVWSAAGTAAGPSRPPRAAAPLAASQALADDVLGAVLRLLGSGRLTGGGRVTESLVAREAHAARSPVRDALLTLASRGLLELDDQRVLRVPVPEMPDVVETYAARRALGTLVVRRACHWTPETLAPVEEALQQLLRTGTTGDSRATGEADLRFQDTLARSTRMRRIPGLFCDLTDQVRLFLAVMGLDYTYSIAGMCRDDTTLMEHVRARDETNAVRAWNRKIDDATAYMTTQLTIAAARSRARARPG